MASTLFQPSTILQYVVILGIIYLFLTGSFTGTVTNDTTPEPDIEIPPSQEKLESLVYPEPNLHCPPHNYNIHIFSRSPLIIYIPNFLSPSESSHLIDISSDKWQPSTIFSNNQETTDTSIRNSSKAMIPRTKTVQCLEQRALSFQGFPPSTFVERLWTQRYLPGGHYSHHYDWAFSSATARRVSTFMVYIDADCTGGGTNFPLLEMPEDKKWCEFVECEGQEERGVTFKPKKGAAVFWENFDADGKGWREGLHAGMPVHSGVKVGLNIWSWYQKGHKAVTEHQSQNQGAL